MFARLLRAPWWVSILIGGVLLLAIPALLIDKYAYVGLAMAIPFFGIGLYRAYRQMGEPAARDLAAAETALRAMSPRDLTSLLTSTFEEDGYTVTPMKDKGADLKLVRDEDVTLVNCKRFKAASSGQQPLRALAGAGERHEASALIYVSLLEPAPENTSFAAEHGIEIVGLESLTRTLGARLSSS